MFKNCFCCKKKQNKSSKYIHLLFNKENKKKRFEMKELRNNNLPIQLKLPKIDSKNKDFIE